MKLLLHKDRNAEVGEASSRSDEGDNVNRVDSDAGVQTRATVEKESRPPKPLK